MGRPDTHPAHDTVDTAARAQRDSGLTLVEVLVTTVMLALVTSVLAASVVVVFRAENGVIASTSESNDTRQIVSFFPLDVESGPRRVTAYRADVGGADGDSGTRCSDAGDENLLRIDVTDEMTGTVDERIAYHVATDGDSMRIDRYVCILDGSAWTVSEVVNIADSVDPTAPPTASVVAANPTSDISRQYVETVTIAYTQRGQAESLAAAPRQEAATSTSDACSGQPLDPTAQVATFVTGDVTLNGTAVKSSLYVGGSLTFTGGVEVAQAVPTQPVAPVPSNIGLLAGSIDWANSSGDLVVKPHRDTLVEDGSYTVSPNGRVLSDPTATSDATISLAAQGDVLVPGTDAVIDAADAEVELRGCSDWLAELPRSCPGPCSAHVTLPADYRGTETDAVETRLGLTDSAANVFNIHEDNLAHLQTIQIKFEPGDQPGDDTPLVINVASDGVVEFEAPTIQGQGANSVYVMWNFPNATSVTVLSGDELRGTIIAPYADVTVDTDLTGGVVASAFEMSAHSLNDVSTFAGTFSP